MVQAANRCGTMNTVMLKVKHRIIIIFWLYRIFLCILMVLNIPISISPERTPTRITMQDQRERVMEKERARTRSKQRKRAIMNQSRFIEKESLFNAVQWVWASDDGRLNQRTRERARCKYFDEFDEQVRERCTPWSWHVNQWKNRKMDR